jgi:pyruvate/2-oxoglutarate dehydrogenase complex dihydrolipoamide acyltransferase (E2) component
LLVKPGDTIKAEQSLITVESDKASMEIPSSHAGVVKELKVKLGDKVKQGSVVLSSKSAGARRRAAAAAPAAAAPAARASPAPAAPAPHLPRHQPGGGPRSKSACPTSATSRTSPSSRCWSSPATPSRSSSR